MHNPTQEKGFTLIEILLAIGILAILATAAIIAINPARQFAIARNTQRWSDVDAIANAVYQYAVSHKGKLPPEILTGDNMSYICLTGVPNCGGISLDSITTDSTYLVAVPTDPSCPGSCSAGTTGYAMSINAVGRVHIMAPNAELGETINFAR